MKKKIFTIIEVILIIIIIYCGYQIIYWARDNMKKNEIINELDSFVRVESVQSNENIEIENQEIEEVKEKYIIDFEGLKIKNSDTVAWLKVNGLENIEYAVVKTKNNDFYLTHSFDKSYNGSGWIFADYRNKADGTDKNLIIYGHNRMDGTMFNSLKDMLKPTWYENKDNYEIILETPEKSLRYTTFSIYQIEAEDYYITTSFKDENEKAKFNNTLKQRSIYDFNVDLQPNDNLLTLSSCANDSKYRVVLHAKLISEELKNN